MLSRTDLKAIGVIVKAEIEPLDKRLGGVEKRMGGMEERIGGVDERLGGVEERLGKVEESLQTVREDVVKVRKDQKIIVNFFDREYLDLRRRVERIEDYLELPQLPELS